MALELIRTVLDFDVYQDDYNTKTILFIDKSYYTENPEKPKLEVILPGFTESKVIPINKSEINVINSSLLGYSKAGEFVDLPDGVYTLTYRICPYDVFYVRKLYLRTVNLEYKLWNILTKKDTFTKEDEKKLFLFDRLLKTAKSHALDNNSVKSQLYYKEAESVINSFKIDC